MAVGAFSAMLLDNLVPGTKEERGIEEREEAQKINLPKERPVSTSRPILEG
jgi:hypothetical protein